MNKAYGIYTEKVINHKTGPDKYDFDCEFAGLELLAVAENEEIGKIIMKSLDINKYHILEMHEIELDLLKFRMNY